MRNICGALTVCVLISVVYTHGNRKPRQSESWGTTTRLDEVEEGIRTGRYFVHEREDGSCVCPGTGITSQPLPPPPPPSEEIDLDYDPRYHADTLEEAILNFPDLTDPNNEFTHPPEPIVGTSQSRFESNRAGRRHGYRKRKNCEPNDEKCKSCASSLLDKVYDAGLVTSQSEKDRIYRNMGLQSFVNSTASFRMNSCRRYRFNKNIDTNIPAVPSELEGWVRDGSSNYERIKTSRDRRGKNWRRGKREAKGDIGTSFDISCVKRGFPETDENESWVVTCSMCWSWRSLPEQYSPRYINELRCDSDDKCIAGYGECHQRVKNLSVKKLLGNGVTEKVDVGTNTCCDCKIRSGSQFHGIVAQ